jgi:hypothetical protein
MQTSECRGIDIRNFLGESEFALKQIPPSVRFEQIAVTIFDVPNAGGGALARED